MSLRKALLSWEAPSRFMSVRIRPGEMALTGMPYSLGR